ncbi:MAG: type II secretion system F family protein [Armatimonadota bacterium]|nr:MAG: type II secretion system F family protein [Armatimonadota bacterium]
MPTFRYRARDDSGALVRGTLAAENERLVKLRVTEMGYFPVAVTEMKERGEKALGFLPRRVRHDDLVVFSWQFAAMIGAGIPLIQCLSALRDQTESPELSRAVGDIRQRVQDGQSLSSAMSRYPQIFSSIMTSMVKSGESGGFLELSLERIAVQMDKDADLRQRVRSAFVYPVLVIGLAIVIVAFLLLFVIPVFAQVYEGAGLELPGTTKALIVVSNFFALFWWAVGLGVVGIVMGARAWARSERGRPKADALKLKMPLFGVLLRKVSIARSIRVLGTLVSTGVPLVDALEDAARVSGNYVIASALQFAIVRVTEGDKLRQPLEASEEFPPMVIQMVAAGEESGDLGGMMNKVADFYDRDIEYTVKRLTTIMEPLLTVVLGAIVGFVAISMYMPIFNLTALLKQGPGGGP